MHVAEKRPSGAFDVNLVLSFRNKEQGGARKGFPSGTPLAFIPKGQHPIHLKGAARALFGTCKKHRLFIGFDAFTRSPDFQQTADKTPPLTPPLGPQIRLAWRSSWGVANQKGRQRHTKPPICYPTAFNNENSLPKRSPRRQNALQDTKLTTKASILATTTP